MKDTKCDQFKKRMMPGKVANFNIGKDGELREIVEYVSTCLTCQIVKAEHQVPSGKLYPLEILKWKWDKITMDFVLRLPLNPSKKNSIWVIVDRLTKSAHFLPVNTTSSLEKLAELYIVEIVCLHGIPSSIVFDRDPRFTSRFENRLQRSLGTTLQFNTLFHP
ncbi:integrase [Gossypium australe]|uniref:Integrase n=1 Tax=Gossypium australe TaxID=47621 RepID=A0A5B6X1N9_9ROSI|nr:integrase [Gossypium australe]